MQLTIDIKTLFQSYKKMEWVHRCLSTRLLPSSPSSSSSFAFLTIRPVGAASCDLHSWMHDTQLPLFFKDRRDGHLTWHSPLSPLSPQSILQNHARPYAPCEYHSNQAIVFQTGFKWNPFSRVVVKKMRQCYSIQAWNMKRNLVQNSIQLINHNIKI